MYNKVITGQEKGVVLGNFVSLSTLQSINYILPVIILPYLIRIIGFSKFGLIAFAQAFVQYFMLLTDYGFSLTATRRISLCRSQREDLSKIFSSVMTVKLLFAALSLIILLAVINFIPKFRKDYLVYLLSFGAVVGNTLFPVWFFQGQEKMKFISVINITAGLVYAVSIFVFVKSPVDYLLVPALNSAYAVFCGITGFFTAFRSFNLQFIRQDYADITSEIKTGWSIFISVICVNAYTSTRVFVVGLLANNLLTGYYAIAERIAGAFQTFPLDSLSQSIYPRLNSIFARNKKRAFSLMSRIQRSTDLIFLGVTPLAIAFAPFIVRVACGHKYWQIILALRVLLVGAYFVAVNAFRIQFLLVCGKQKEYSRIHVAAALLGLPLIIASVYYLSYLRAALSTVVIEAGILLASIKILRSYWRSKLQ
jgi:PST family polysaccharide transporter